jgi:hypothetical protein
VGTQADGAQGAQEQDGQQGGGAPADPRGWLPEEFRADKVVDLKASVLDARPAADA